MQIDWISAITATPPELWPGYTSGELLKVSPDGEVVDRRSSMFSVTDEDPSSSANFTVWTPNPGTLYLSGNPCKLLQRHNLWGSPDLLASYLEAGVFVRHYRGLFPGPETWKACRFTFPRFTRLDLTRSYRFKSQAEADDYVRYIAGNARSRHGAATLVGGTTAYFGQHSRRWAFKVYAKFHEVAAPTPTRRLLSQLLSPIKPRGALHPDLIDWSRGVVRFELTLRAPELQNHDIAHLTSSEHLLTLWQQYHDRILFSENTAMNTQNAPLNPNLPPRLQGALSLWREGRDLRGIYSRPTFYRYRAEILKLAGIDISIPPASDAPSTARSALDPAGWDPEPLKAYTVPPRAELRDLYGL
jgi:hypothetical protein